MVRLKGVTHRGTRETSILERERAAAKRKSSKPGYKIVMEPVVQQKRKLGLTHTFASHAPPGYYFVPVELVEVTEHCKEICRRRNLEVYVVSTRPRKLVHEDPTSVSFHINRKGFHFPEQIVSDVCDTLGYVVKRHGLEKVYGYSDRLEKRIQQQYNSRVHQSSPGKESPEEIAALIHELFPKAPDHEVEDIVKHAFSEGTKRVGNAHDLELPRRIQLAVLAHIRHTHTSYDMIIKALGWAEARRQVEPICLAKLLEWRNEDNTDEMEEVFRETIVIEDDDDGEQEGAQGASDRVSDLSDGDSSMEIISSRTAAHELHPDVRRAGGLPGDARLPATQPLRQSYFLRPVPRQPAAPHGQNAPLHAANFVEDIGPRSVVAPNAGNALINESPSAQPYRTAASWRLSPSPNQEVGSTALGPSRPEHLRESAVTYACSGQTSNHNWGRIPVPQERPLPAPVHMYTSTIEPNSADSLTFARREPKQYRRQDGAAYEYVPLEGNEAGSRRNSMGIYPTEFDYGRSVLVPITSRTSGYARRPAEAHRRVVAQGRAYAHRDYSPPPRRSQQIPEEDVALPSIEREIGNLSTGHRFTTQHDDDTTTGQPRMSRSAIVKVKRAASPLHDYSEGLTIKRLRAAVLYEKAESTVDAHTTRVHGDHQGGLRRVVTRDVVDLTSSPESRLVDPSLAASASRSQDVIYMYRDVPSRHASKAPLTESFQVIRSPRRRIEYVDDNALPHRRMEDDYYMRRYDLQHVR